MKPTVYIESTIVSYLTSRPSRDLIVAAHQQITDEWWNIARLNVECLVSPFVLQEISAGDKEAAQKRLEATRHLSVLELNLEIQELAETYFEALKIPEKARLVQQILSFCPL